LSRQEEVLGTHVRTIKNLKDENIRLRERNENLNEHLKKDKIKSLSPQRKFIRLGSTQTLKVQNVSDLKQKKQIHKSPKEKNDKFDKIESEDVDIHELKKE